MPYESVADTGFTRWALLHSGLRLVSLYCRKGTNSASSVFCRIRTVFGHIPPLRHNWAQYKMVGKCVTRVSCTSSLYYRRGSDNGHLPTVSKLLGFLRTIVVGKCVTRVGFKSLLQKRKWRAQFQDDGTARWEELPFVPAPSIRWMRGGGVGWVAGGFGGERALVPHPVLEFEEKCPALAVDNWIS